MLACRLQEHALRSAGVFPAVLEPPPEPEPAAGADGEERQLVPGTHWAIEFDEDGEVRSRLPTQSTRPVRLIAPRLRRWSMWTRARGKWCLRCRRRSRRPRRP